MSNKPNLKLHCISYIPTSCLEYILLDTSRIFFRYDGETFVKEVDVNYIMWEQHGRAGYKYSATMKEVSSCNQKHICFCCNLFIYFLSYFL